MLARLTEYCRNDNPTIHHQKRSLLAKLELSGYLLQYWTKQKLVLQLNIWKSWTLKFILGKRFIMLIDRVGFYCLLLCSLTTWLHRCSIFVLMKVFFHWIKVCLLNFLCIVFFYFLYQICVVWIFSMCQFDCRSTEISLNKYLKC